MLREWSYNFHSNCQFIFLTLKKCSQKLVTLDNTRIIRPKFLLHWNFYRFLSKILYFQQPRRSWRSSLISCTKIVKRRCATPQKAPWGFPYSILREMLVKYCFSLERLPFFRKIVLSTISQVLQKWSYLFHSSCQNTLWTLITLFPRFDILDNTRKLLPKILFTGKFAFFPGNLYFQQPVRCYRNYLLTSTVIVRILFPPHKLSPEVFCSIKLQKIRPISFLHWRACLFLLEILCFQQHLRSRRIDHVTCKMFVKTTCGRLNVVACCLSYSINQGKLVI